jgi:hypothetical protein
MANYLSKDKAMRAETRELLKNSAAELDDICLDTVMSEEYMDDVQQIIEDAAKAIRKAIASDNDVQR